MATDRRGRVEDERKTLIGYKQSRVDRRDVPSGKKVMEARSSTTDPEARMMKMADGDIKPKTGLQCAVSTYVESGIILEVMVGNSGTDLG